MGLLTEIHQEHQGELERSINDCRDVKEAADVLRAYWDALRAAYMQSLRTQQERDTAAPLFEAMIEGTGFCAAMTRTEIERRALPTITLPGKPSYTQLARRYGAPALCMIASAICILSGETLASLCTLLSAAATGFAALRQSEPRGVRTGEEIVRATVRPEVQELCARMNKGVSALDALLERAQRLSARKAEPLEEITWTRRELESVQQLWEAYEDGDGEYALKVVPGLLSELAAQEISIRRYGECAEEHFDLLPGLVSGQTIRPAVYAGEKLLVRGQATCEPEKVEVTGL